MSASLNPSRHSENTTHQAPSIQLIQMLQPRQHNLLTRLLDLPGQKHLIQNRINLIKVKHQIQLTHIPEELVQDFDKEVYGLEVSEFIVVGVDAGAEEEARVAPVDYLGGAAELDEVGLVLLVARGDEAVDFTFEFDFVVVGVGVVPFC